MQKVSIILLDNEKVNILDFANKCKQFFVDYEIFFCTKTKTSELENVTQIVTNESNIDKILNAIIPKTNGDKLCIIREYSSNFDDVKNMTNKVQKDNQLCKIKEKHGKFIDFFKNLLDIIINFLFGYTLFHTSLAMLVFGKDCTVVLKTLSNCSTYTKVNKWAGIDILEQEVSSAKAVKFKPKLLGCYIKIAVCFLLTVASILCFALINYKSPMIFLKTLYILIIAISITILLVQIIIICVKNLVGDNECGKIDTDKKENI